VVVNEGRPAMPSPQDRASIADHDVRLSHFLGHRGRRLGKAEPVPLWARRDQAAWSWSTLPGSLQIIADQQNARGRSRASFAG
jgi:hypothetical protein